MLFHTCNHLLDLGAFGGSGFVLTGISFLTSNTVPILYPPPCSRHCETIFIRSAPGVA